MMVLTLLSTASLLLNGYMYVMHIWISNFESQMKLGCSPHIGVQKVGAWTWLGTLWFFCNLRLKTLFPTPSFPSPHSPLLWHELMLWFPCQCVRCYCWGVQIWWEPAFDGIWVLARSKTAGLASNPTAGLPFNPHPLCPGGHQQLVWKRRRQN